VLKWWFFETSRVRLAKESYHISFGDHATKPTLEEFLAKRKSIPRDYQPSIKSWILWWPFSALWTLLDDPIRRAVQRIYQELQTVYQRITDKVWGV
jgi:hypothetical protein